MRKFAALLVLLFLVTLGAVAQSSVGDVWYASTNVATQPGQTFTTDMLVNTGTLKLAAYTFKMTFTEVIAVNKAVGTQGVTAGPDGFVTVVNPQATSLTISSFDVSGKPASTSLRLLTVNWNAVSNGATTIVNDVQALSNEATTTIGQPRAVNSVTVQVGIVTTPTPTKIITPTPVTPTPTKVITPTPVTPTPTKIITPTPVTATPTKAVTPTPTQVVITPTPVHPVGEVWFVPSSVVIPVNASRQFSTDVQVNTGNQKLAAYTFEMTFGTIISVDTSVGTQGVTAGAQGFVTVVNPKAGMLTISSFDVNGTGPSPNLALISIAWKADGVGQTTINNKVTALSDELTKQIGATLVGKPCSVTIEGTATPTPTKIVTPTPTQVIITPTPTKIVGDVVFAVNCGGSAYTASDGTNFAADTGFSGGSTYTNTKTISGTSDPTLFQSERYGNCTYTATVPNGDYVVSLYFAETFHTQAGLRTFDVLMEGATVINDLDLYAQAGANTAYVAQNNVTVSDGALNIQFVTVLENAKINAIKVVKSGTVITPTPTQVVVTPTPTQVVGAGDVWFVEPNINLATAGGTFTTNVQVNTGNQKLAAYTFEMAFSTIISVNTAVGTQGVTAGPQGFVTVVNPQPGKLTISSFDVNGTGPSATLQLLSVSWKADSPGTTTITNKVTALSDELTKQIGTPNGKSIQVSIGGPTPTQVVVTPTPTQIVVTGTPPVHPVGEVWFVEPSINLTSAGGTFTTNVQVNTGTQKLAAYTFEMAFSTIISVNTAVGTQGVTAGPQGFVTVVNPQPGKLTISSFDVNGTGPSTGLQLLSVSWKADGAGTTTITNNVTALSDELTKDIGTKVGKSIQVSIGGIPTPTPTQTVITPTPTKSITPTTVPPCAGASLPLNIDGTGSKCVSLTSITNYVNSWETTSVKINGVDFTNKWASASSLPAKVNGVYNIEYVGKASWSHFEAR